MIRQEGLHGPHAFIPHTCSGKPGEDNAFRGIVEQEARIHFLLSNAGFEAGSILVMTNYVMYLLANSPNYFFVIILE